MPVQRTTPLNLIRPCTAAEVWTHCTYLARTANEGGGWRPQQATPGLYEWFKASVLSLASLGELPTSFAWGRSRPTVKVMDVVPVLKGNGYDHALLERIGQYRQGLRTGAYECVITVVSPAMGNPFTILDGCKHAIAYYENKAEEGEEQIDLEFFFLRERRTTFGTGLFKKPVLHFRVT
jgi:hypothetical protein